MDNTQKTGQPHRVAPTKIINTPDLQRLSACGTHRQAGLTLLNPARWLEDEENPYNNG